MTSHQSNPQKKPLDAGLGFNPFIISGSAHREGNTTTATQAMLGDVPTAFLCELNIAQYRYGKANGSDDFLPLIHRLVKCDPLVFATPVYWYAMSGYMKVFWDRITDLFYHHKDLFKQFQGKTAMIIVSSANGKPEGFEMPLEKTFAYLKMPYAGCWDHIFPLDKHAEHNDQQKSLAMARWKKLEQDFQERAWSARAQDLPKV